MKNIDLSQLKYDPASHFEFGENWAKYSEQISEQEIGHAVDRMKQYLQSESLEGRSFLDIGCGSGIHALAALRLGAKAVTAIDIDGNSVATTQKILGRFWTSDNYRVQQHNILSDAADPFGTFDIVYSWGVLHHTGDLWEAIRRAAALVKPNGSLAIAVYRRTKLCAFWAKEKRFYTNSGPLVRSMLDWTYILLRSLRDLVRLKSPARRWRRHSKKKRGMKWRIDIVDWLGGYPYESATPEEIEQFLAGLGFKLVRSRKANPHLELGLFGTGNAEYLFQR